MQNVAGTRAEKWHKSDTAGSWSVPPPDPAETKTAAQAGPLDGGNWNNDADGKDGYHKNASAATSRTLVASEALRSSRLFGGPPANPELIAGYASGDIATIAARSAAKPAGRRFEGRFTRPRAQRTPDRDRSIRRRRTLAATWPMPPVMAGMLTTSQVAYARIIADEVHRTGQCELTLDEIAARGGMCRKTAKRAQDRLAELAWIGVEQRPVQGRKHLSNVVRIISREWSAWIAMGPKPRRIGGHSCPTTENRCSKRRSSGPAEMTEGAFREGQWRCRAPKAAARV